MSSIGVASLARRFLVETWGQNRAETVDELADENLTVFYPVLKTPLRGRPAFKALLAGHHAVLADIELMVNEIIATADRAVVCSTQRVTQHGEFLGIPTTGKSATFTAITLYRIQNGKIIEERGEEDLYGLLECLRAAGD